MLKPSLIFIMLGKECNLNCRYCLQHKILEKEISHNINPDIYPFLEKYKPRLHFFGGEPLLFFDTIKEISEVLENSWMPKFSVMTNGKLLTEEKISWLNEHKFWVSVSWDGFNSFSTRGYDVLSNKKNVLLDIEHLSLSAVISSADYPIAAADAFTPFCEQYKDRHGKYPGLNYDNIFNTGVTPKDLLSFDYEKLSEEISFLTKEYISSRKSGIISSYPRYKYIDDIYQEFRPYYQNEDIRIKEDDRKICRCGNGYTVFNLSLDGGLYSCHNSSEKLGTIYDPPEDYLKRVISADVTKDRDCKDCPAISYCKKGCKIVKDMTDYCKLRKTIFTAVTKTLIGGV